MIKRAWEKNVQIQTYLNSLELERSASGRVPVEDYLHTDDWRVLGEIQQALEPIYRMTVWAEAWNSGRDGKRQLWSPQTGIEYVHEHLEQLKGIYHDESADQLTALTQEQARPQPGRPTRRRYYQLRLYNEAILPEHVRAAYTSWLIDAKQGLEAYFDRWYGYSEASGDPLNLSPSPGPQEQQQGPQMELSQFEQWFKSRRPRSQGLNDEEGELQRYYRLRIEQVDDPVKWWADRRTEFPRLSSLL
ncbi:hypothetical protein HD806DRAFT_536045 [Xylariaceae sp. AK1471]|nr:hypothetical protein HD806DRAFT_536045 [Xylariaceae sp. AK1471]